MLERRHTLREPVELLKKVEEPALSRLWFGSPCRFVRQVDVVVHIILPEMLEKRLPRVADYLRRTSPRWGRSWRDWSR